MYLPNLLFYRFVPERVRFRLSAMTRPLRSVRGKTPIRLSVIVPVYNVEEYVRETLDSLRRQQLANLEIIVVDDGSTDDSRRVVEECRALDPRIVVLTQANAGLGAARNTGIRAAKGEYLTFIDSDDIIPTDAFAHMVNTLDRTGSDFAVGKVVRFQAGKYWLPDFSIKAHDRERLATNIREYPTAMFDILACNRVYRRDFWNREIGEFPEGMLYEDHAPSTDAYLRARAFDMLQRVTYDWRERGDRSSITQQNYLLNNLKGRIAASDLAQVCVERFGDRDVLAAWAGRVIAMGFTEYIGFALAGSQEYRETLQKWIRQIYALAPEEAFEYAAPGQKTYSYFASLGQWERAQEIREEFSRLNYKPPTVVRDGVLYADRGAFTSDAARELPENFLRMSRFESEGGARVDRVTWQPNGDLRVEGWANIRFADSAALGLEMNVVLRGTDGSPGVAATVERRSSERPDYIYGYPHADHSGTYFSATWSAAELRAALRGGASPRLQVDLNAGGLRATAHVVYWTADGSHLALRWASPRGGLKVYVSETYGLLVTRGRAQREREESLERRIRWARRFVSTKFSRVEAVACTDEEVTIDFRSRARRDDACGARMLTGRGDELGQQRVEALGGSRYRLHLVMRDTSFGLAPALPEPGAFRISMPGREDAVFRVSRRLLETFPVKQITRDYEYVPCVDGNRAFRLSMHNHGLLEYRSQKEIERARREHANRTDAVLERGSVLLQCYLGQTFTDSELDIAEYLVKHRPEMRVMAGVRHPGVRLPEGVEPLVIDSPEWIHALSTAEFLVNNIDFPAWFVRVPSQKFLQTFHGHPFKNMGKQYWEKVFEFSPDQVEKRLQKRRETWTHIVSPSEIGDTLYDAAYPDIAERILTGMPRTDALVNDTGRSRADIVAGLGISDASFVVLFAPTWRDSLSTSGWTAHTFLEFDPQRLANELGDGAVVLLRGHNFNSRQAERVGAGGRVIDVTNYPEINDLVRVSDAAILDYSSLRFEYAITEKPMVFFVPDEEEYFAGRPGLLPFRETAPGPIVKDEEVLIAELRRMREDRSPHPDLAGFNERFNALHDGHATERVVNAFFGPRGAGA